MTVTDGTTDRSGTRSATTDDEWVSECAQILVPDCFPARQDELLAALMRRRAPSRLLWHLARLDPNRVYPSLDAVVRDCQQAEAPSTARPPWG